MLKKEWKEIRAISNMCEADERIVAHKEADIVEIAYMAYDGFKTVSFSGVEDVTPLNEFMDESEVLQVIKNTVGDDFEVALVLKHDVAGNILVAVDCNSELTVLSAESKDTDIPDDIYVAGVEEFDADNIGDAPVDALALYGLS